MKNLLRSISIMMALAVLPISGWGATTTWYVNSFSGSDITGDGSSGNPWATLTHALAQSSVINGDTLDLIGTFDENPVVTKEVTIYGGRFEFSSAAGSAPFPYGLKIEADNVAIYNMEFENTAGGSFSGAFLYASHGGTPISGLRLEDCTFSTIYNIPSPATVVTCAVIDMPRGCILINCHAALDNGLGMAGPVEDNGFLFMGGAADGAQRNQIISCGANGMTHITGEFAGFGLCIMPSATETAEAYDIIDGVFASTLSQGILLDDSFGPANPGGIRDITITENMGSGIYSNDRNIEILGATDGSSEDISDIRIAGIQALGYAADAGIMIRLESGITPNIDFSSIYVHNCNIDSNTGYAIRNWVNGETLDARFNYYGNTVDPLINPSTGPNDDASVINGNGDQITVGVDGTSWRPTSLLDSAFIAVPGGGASLSLIGTGIGYVDMTLASGETGFVSAALLDGPPNQGFFGMVGNIGVSHSMNIVTDIPDGNFVALLRVGYSDFFVNNVIPGAEEDIILYSWDETGSIWAPAVEFNTAGTPQWLGAAATPTLPLQASDLGKYGVDTANNLAWAVIDHFTEFSVGEGDGGLGVPVELSVFSVD